MMRDGAISAHNRPLTLDLSLSLSHLSLSLSSLSLSLSFSHTTRPCFTPPSPFACFVSQPGRASHASSTSAEYSSQLDRHVYNSSSEPEGATATGRRTQPSKSLLCSPASSAIRPHSSRRRLQLRFVCYRVIRRSMSSLSGSAASMSRRCACVSSERSASSCNRSREAPTEGSRGRASLRRVISSRSFVCAAWARRAG